MNLPVGRNDRRPDGGANCHHDRMTDPLATHLTSGIRLELRFKYDDWTMGTTSTLLRHPRRSRGRALATRRHPDAMPRHNHECTEDATARRLADLPADEGTESLVEDYPNPED